MRKLHLVEVEWEDTTSSKRWEDEANADVELAIVHTVGWQLKKTRKHILLTSQRDATYNIYTDREKIPMGCVRVIRRIE